MLGRCGVQADPASRSVVLAVETDYTVSTRSCNTDAWADSAAFAAQSLPTPINLQDYTFRLFVLPGEAGGGTCTFGGTSRPSAPVLRLLCRLRVLVL